MIRNVSALGNIWKIPDLKKKMVYTALILLIYRIGVHIPIPFIDSQALAQFIERARQGVGAGLFSVVDMFSGSAFSQMSVLALGIMPYISVSIIIQLLAVVYPKLQKMQQEGALGQQKINRLTRQFTVLLAVIQGFAMAMYFNSEGLSYMRGGNSWLFIFTATVAMTAGTTFLMWLGERITEDGIGNGISLIIAVGIMASYPSDAISIIAQLRGGLIENSIWGVLIPVLFVISTISIILIQVGIRRIPMQAAKRVVGRKMMGGGSNYLPLKINTAGVIPVIFASAILAFPSFLSQILPGGAEGGMGAAVGNFFSIASTSNLYNAFGLDESNGILSGGIFQVLKAFNAHIILFALMTGFFCYFYTAVTFNPDDIANNLKKSGSFVPGKRPGRPTSEYIDYVLTRITTFGALFLVVIAVMPMVLQVAYGMPAAANSFVGGTGLIIVVGVIIDTLKQVESQLLMRHYDGYSSRRTTSRWR